MLKITEHCRHENYKNGALFIVNFRQSEIKNTSLKSKRRIGGGRELDEIDGLMAISFSPEYSLVLSNITYPSRPESIDHILCSTYFPQISMLKLLVYLPSLSSHLAVRNRNIHICGIRPLMFIRISE